MELEAKTISIVDIANGALRELIDYEMSNLMKNIADINTPWKPARELTIKLKFTTNENRELITVTADVKPKLQQSKPIESQLFMGTKGDNIEAVEVGKTMPGQISIDGEVETPHILRLPSREAI